MSRRGQRRPAVSVMFAGGVAIVGLFIAFLIAVRQHSAPSLRLVSKRLVMPGEVRVDDWLDGHSRVTSVEVLENSDVLVRTATELIVCRADVAVAVLRRRGTA